MFNTYYHKVDQNGGILNKKMKKKILKRKERRRIEKNQMSLNQKLDHHY
jgi:hypothetical protein